MNPAFITTKMAMDELVQNYGIEGQCAVLELIAHCSDPAHAIPEADIAILKGFSLVDHMGKVHNVTREAVLALTKKNEKEPEKERERKQESGEEKKPSERVHKKEARETGNDRKPPSKAKKVAKKVVEFADCAESAGEYKTPSEEEKADKGLYAKLDFDIARMKGDAATRLVKEPIEKEQR